MIGPTDYRLGELADEAKVRPSHVHHLIAWLAAGNPADRFAAFARLEQAHVDRMLAALGAHDLLPVCGGSTKRRRHGMQTSRPERGTRLPDLFQEPPEWIAWAQKERRWDEVTARKTLAEFVDYWHGVPGQRGVKLDWFATFRNWCRRSQAPDGIFVPGASPPEHDAERRWLIEERARLTNGPWDAVREAEWTRRRDAAYGP